MWLLQQRKMFHLVAILLGCLVYSGFSAAVASATEIKIDVAEACTDKEDGCAGWASDDYCTTQRDLMSYYCPSTCGFCNTVQEATDIMTEIVESMVEATDPSTNGGSYEDTSDEKNYDYNSDNDNGSNDYEANYEANYDSDYDSGYDSGYEVKSDTVTPAITNQCAGEIRNGELKDMTPSSYGSVDCTEGFTRTGPYYIYCNEQGIITGDLPTCERKCSEIKIEGGNIEPPENEKQGWLYVSCNEGKTLEGKAWNWCDRGVVDVIPKCVGGETASEEQIISPDTDSEVDYDTDYKEEEEEYTEKKKEEEEEMRGGAYGGCPLKEVENGMWTDPYQSSTYWILECNTGYVKNGGDSYVYCDDKKEVTGVAPQCEEDKCANAKVENGVVTTSGSGAWIWVKVECNPGYSLSGSDGTYCSSTDGGLSAPLGTCNM